MRPPGPATRSQVRGTGFSISGLELSTVRCLGVLIFTQSGVCIVLMRPPLDCKVKVDSISEDFAEAGH